MLHAAERQCELGGGREKRRVSVGLMKRIADNPHDEHLGAEIAAEEDGEIFSS